MKREILISKWLNNDLNDQELEAFKNLDDYNDLMKLNLGLQAFKIDDYNTTNELNDVLAKIKKTPPKKQWLKPFLRIAAILTICFSLYYYTNSINTSTIATTIAQKTTIDLPDSSSVSLNAESSICFNKGNWKSKRHIELQGEAFFKVAKGSTFNVVTNSGTITVYGTEFNVKQRHNYFEVICYEGLVGVTHHDQETKLRPGDRFLIINGEKIATEKENLKTPSWLHNESSFKSLPYQTVIDEFERHYNVNVKLININPQQLFTGSFTHDSLEIALKSITLPLHLTHSKTKDTIVLKRE